MSKPLKSSKSPTGDDTNLKNMRNLSNNVSILEEVPVEMDYESSLASTRKIASDLLRLRVLINSPNRILKSSSSLISQPGLGNAKIYFF